MRASFRTEGSSCGQGSAASLTEEGWWMGEGRAAPISVSGSVTHIRARAVLVMGVAIALVVAASAVPLSTAWAAGTCGNLNQNYFGFTRNPSGSRASGAQANIETRQTDLCSGASTVSAAFAGLFEVSSGSGKAWAGFARVTGASGRYWLSERL